MPKTYKITTTVTGTLTRVVSSKDYPDGYSIDDIKTAEKEGESDLDLYDFEDVKFETTVEDLKES